MPLTDDPWLPYNGDGSVDPIRAATPIGCYRYDGASTFQELPNVRCLHVEHREGPTAGQAAFRYDFASGLDGAPTAIEEALSTGSSGDYLVATGDRLVVQATRPDGGVDCIFDGLALEFGLGLSGSEEGAHFLARGIAARCWDDPISSAVYRNANDVANTAANIQTQLQAHFNPGGLPNAVKQVHEVGTQGDGDRAYPVFLDERVIRDPDVRRLWTVPMAVRYLLYRNNDETYVINPDAGDIDALFTGRVPKGADKFNPDDPATYDVKDLIVPDLPVTGKDWPSTIEKLIGDVGFNMMFRLNTTGDGLPQTVLGLYRPQAGPAKWIYLSPRGSAFDPRTANFNAASLSRDVSGVANAYVVRGAPERYEASFILAPGFPSSSADGSQGSLGNFEETSSAFAANRNKYRLYVFDETGEGHYANGSTTILTAVPSLDALFGAPAGTPAAAKYAGRRRKPLGTLFSKDALGRRLKATLSISTNYAGTTPGLWDGSGTWQAVAASGWSLLEDRLGIRIDAANPNAWKIKASKVAGHPFNAGVVKGVESQCGMAGAQPFKLRLTCVVESDQCVQYAAERQPESALPYRVVRLVDAKDRIKHDTISKFSEFNATATAFADRIPADDRDDSDAAKNEAIAIQLATQSGVLDGPVTIPRFTGYYGIGTRIAGIEGRGLGLRTDGDPTDSNVVYPVVIGIRWDFQGGQRTTLTLSDSGGHRARARVGGGRGRKHWSRRTNTGH